MPICETCLKTPFPGLPSEEEAAHPHHQSIDDLEASATECPLCRLILESLRQLIETRANEEYDGHAAGAVRMAELLSTEENPGVITCTLKKAGMHQRTNQEIRVIKSGETEVTVEVTDLSSKLAATIDSVDLGKFGKRPATFDPRPCGEDDSDNVVRPWLYGNWWVLKPPVPLPNMTALANKVAVPLSLIGIGVRLTKWPESHDCQIYKTKVTHYRGSSLRVFTDDDDLLAPWVPGRLRELDCQSAKSFGRVQEWIRTCNDHHGCAPVEPQLPTRILDLGTDPSISRIALIESDAQYGRYIALSYCWGKAGEQLTTTTATLEDHKHGINIGELPQTFQDIVLLARKLEVRYIWIDSLCIIQDDENDWEAEAPKMSQVYSNSYLTVAASSSKSSSEGCFPSSRLFSYISTDGISSGEGSIRNPLEFVEADFRVSGDKQCRLYFAKEWMRASNKIQPLVYCTGTFGQTFDPVAIEYLSSRAWTLQERLLSPRTLHYGQQQMFWECKKCFSAEDGARFSPDIFCIDRVLGTQRQPGRDHGAGDSWATVFEGQDPSDLPIRPFHGRWHGGWLSMITDFSKRRLTYPDDKLPALSGLASLIVTQTGDRYLAGLWRDHLFEDLHWKAEDMRTLKRLRNIWGVSETFEKKRLSSRAPSWSWASVEAEIEFKPLKYDHLVAEIIDCETTPLGKDIFGRVSSGWIDFLAPLLEIKRRDLQNYPGDERVAPELRNESRDSTLVQIHLDHGVSIGVAFFDFEIHFPSFALFLDISNALILKPAGRTENEFERIGIARFVKTQSQADTSMGNVFSDSRFSGPITDGVPRFNVRIV